MPTIPTRALVFNSAANEANILDIIREACALNGLVMDVIGYGSGNPSFHPEEQLGAYDIIFAVGRAALESLAIGAAVINCGLGGAGQMVTTQNLEWLRRNNFGIRVMSRPVTASILSKEIQRYNALDAMEVSQQVRKMAGLGGMVDQIMKIYSIALNGLAKDLQPDPVAESLAISSYLKEISYRYYQTLGTSNLALEQAKALQGELDFIKGSLTWQLYTRLNRISFLHDLYMRVITPIRHWRSRHGKK